MGTIPVSDCKYSLLSGGEGGIRTHGTREGSTVFETARFNRSRTSPFLNLADLIITCKESRDYRSGG